MKKVIIKMSALRTLLKKESINSSGMFCPCVAIQLYITKQGKAEFFISVLANSHGLSDIKGHTLWTNEGQYKHNKSEVYDYISENIEDVIKNDLQNAYNFDYESDFVGGYEIIY